MPLMRARMEDHRGQRWRLHYGLTVPEMLMQLDDDKYRAVCVALGGDWGFFSTRKGSIVVPAGGIGLALVVGAFNLSAGRMTAMWPLLLLLFGLFMLLAVTLANLIGRSRLPAVAEALLRLMVCPICTYDLHGVRVETDGCSVCPECGAAWRVPDSQDETGHG